MTTLLRPFSADISQTFKRFPIFPADPAAQQAAEPSD